MRFLILLVCLVIVVPEVESAPAIRMPVMANEAMRCDQGNGDCNDTHCPDRKLEFAWDFNLGGTYGNEDLGLPVVASASGLVVFAVDAKPGLDDWGKCVVIRYAGDPENHRGLYAHLDKIFVVPGEFVRQGQVVGALGNADGRWSAHLHYQDQRGDDPNAWSVSASFADVGVPISPVVYTSENDSVMIKEFDSNGGAGSFGSPNGPVHWYHPYDDFAPNNLYRGGQVPNNCYVRNYSGGSFGNCGIVYDALGGARRAYTVRTGFWFNAYGNGWTQEYPDDDDEDTDFTGPRSWLGMPITNEYETDPGYAARQDFVGGWLNWISGVCARHTWVVCSPGWTAAGWDPQVSYRIADEYVRLGRFPVLGEPTGVVVLNGGVWTQPFSNGTVEVPEDYGTGGQPPLLAAFDFDGDGLTDLWDRTASGEWRIDYAANGFTGWEVPNLLGYGGSLDTPCPADYDGDGSWDLAILRSSDRVWFVDRAENGFGAWDLDYGGYGESPDFPLPADYDGDAFPDLAVRTSDARWRIDYSVNGFVGWEVDEGGYGSTIDTPCSGDFDGDGKADLAVLRNSDRKFLIDYAANGFVGWDVITLGGYGGAGDKPCPADYDGDGTTDIAVLTVTDRVYHIDYFANGFGAWDENLGGYGGSGDTPKPGDYDGDGKDDIAIYFPATGQICLDKKSNGFGAWDNCYGGHPMGSSSFQPEFTALPYLRLSTPAIKTVTIAYALPKDGRVQLTVYDIAGRRRAVIVDRVEPKGEHQFTWKPDDLPAGVYFVRLVADDLHKVAKVVLLQ